MSVIRVNELLENETELKYSFTPDDDAERHFQVLCSLLSDNEATIIASGMIPLPGSGHPYLGQNCRTLTITRKKGAPRWWDVTAQYADSPVKPPQDPNPLNRPAILTGDARQYSAATLVDINNNATTNSFGDVFDPIERDDSRWMFSVTKNVPYDAIPGFVLTANNTINSDPFTITQLGLTCDAETLKVQEFKFSDIKSELVPSGGSFTLIQYRALSFGLSFREEGWKYKTPDRGYRGFDPGESGQVPIVFYEFDKNHMQRKCSRPTYLDGTGFPLFDPASQVPITVSEIVYMSFDLYNDFDFSQLTPYVT